MSPWPPVTYESRPWTSKYASNPATPAAYRQTQPEYSAAVPASIGALGVLLSGATITAVTDAAVAIARLDTALGSEIAPFASVLLRSESAASSRIEELTASARAIGEAELGGRQGSNAASIVGNTQAMSAAISLSGELSIATIERMHHALLEHSEPVIAGVLRQEQVWIGGGSRGPQGATFVPPHHERVRPALDDLVVFMNRWDLPVLIQAAVAHAQFETIHPFVDGNGRTGRALVHALLRNKGLTRNVSVPISAGLVSDTSAYFDALTAYGQGDIEPIVQQFAEASFVAIDNGTVLVDDLRLVRARWAETVSARSDALVHRVADLLVRQPVVNARTAADALDVELRNVLPAIERLAAAEILVPSNLHKRGRIWRAPEVLRALDDFAARSGRRTREHRAAPADHDRLPTDPALTPRVPPPSL